MFSAEKKNTTPSWNDLCNAKYFWIVSVTSVYNLCILVMGNPVFFTNILELVLFFCKSKIMFHLFWITDTFYASSVACGTYRFCLYSLKQNWRLAVYAWAYYNFKTYDFYWKTVYNSQRFWKNKKNAFVVPVGIILSNRQ